MHAGQQFGTIRGGELTAKNRLHSSRREGGFDNQEIQVVANIAERVGLTAPPSGDGRQLQTLSQQSLAETGQKGHERGSLNEATAERISDGDVPGPDCF